jgi:putative lipoic acid-binding regulatory protein
MGEREGGPEVRVEAVISCHAGIMSSPAHPRTAPARELLLANHQFPGEYIVKAFGPHTEQFRSEIRACATAVVGETRATVDERLSRRGSRMCITVTLHAQTVDEVIGVYERMYEVEGLMLIL